MAKYYFDVYDVDRDTRYRKTSSLPPSRGDKEIIPMGDYYDSYDFQSWRGFKGSGKTYISYPSDVGKACYEVTTTQVYRVVATSVTDLGEMLYKFNLTYTPVASAESYYDYSRGKFIKTIIAEENEYPSYGRQGGYWYDRKEIVNSPPTEPQMIQVPSEVFSGQKVRVTWSESTDPDGDEVMYKLEREVNGNSKWTQVYQGKSQFYDDTVLDSWSSVKYRIRAYDTHDNHSGYTTSDSRTVTHNRPPTISGEDSDLGIIDDKLDIEYIINDADNDRVSVTIHLNDLLLLTVPNVELGKKYVFTVEGNNLLMIPNGKHTVRITATDEKGANTVRRYNFEKKITQTTVTLSEPLPSEEAISKAIMSVKGKFPEGVDIKVELTNNANSDKPVWIDVTENISKGSKIFFKQVDDDSLAFNFRVTMDRKDEGEPAYIRSIGGNFE